MGILLQTNNFLNFLFQMRQATYKKHLLNFKQASGTSRGVLKTKETYLLKIFDGEKEGYGECGLFRGLSADDKPDYEEKLQWACDHISYGKDFLISKLNAFPSIQFGLELTFNFTSIIGFAVAYYFLRYFR